MTSIAPVKRRGLFRRKLLDRVVRALSVLALTVAVAAMVWILYTVIRRGVAVISWDFLTECSKPYGAMNSGIANALLARWRSPSARRWLGHPARDSRRHLAG